MTSGLRTTVLALGVSALVLLPMVADAQGHHGGHVAVPRTSVSGGVGVGRYHPYYYRPYYHYDPFFFGSFAFGFGVGYGYGYGPYYGYPYYPYAYPYYAQYPYPYYGYYDSSASLRLQVTPRETQVYIDGYYAGTVDDFDGMFQRLHLEPGQHELQLYLPGHRNYSQKIYLQPASTFGVRHTMEQLSSGDPEPVKPVAQAGPPPNRARRPPPPERVPPPSDSDRDRDADRNRGRATADDLGTLTLRVQPGDASISIDGERWEGPADGERLTIQLPAGMHNIQIRKDGYRTYNTDVTLRRGENTPVNVALTKQ